MLLQKTVAENSMALDVESLRVVSLLDQYGSLLSSLAGSYWIILYMLLFLW